MDLQFRCKMPGIDWPENDWDLPSMDELDRYVHIVKNSNFIFLKSYLHQIIKM